MSIRLFSADVKGKKLEFPTCKSNTQSPPTFIPKAKSFNCVELPSFENVPFWLKRSLLSLGITSPTAVQAGCIPEILSGRDVVAMSKTGSGKTAAFAIPILTRLSEDPFGVFALVLSPTRELVLQISEQFKVFGEGINLNIGTVIGGLDIIEQAANMATKRPHILVATPGRLADILRSSPDTRKPLSRLKFLVFDEADRLLGEECFIDPISEILLHCNPRRQNLFFSATLPHSLLDSLVSAPISNTPSPNDVDRSDPSVANVQSFDSHFVTSDCHLPPPSPSPSPSPFGLSLVDPFIFNCKESYDVVSTLIQYSLLVPSMVREVYLVHLLTVPYLNTPSIIIFVGKCKTAELLSLMFSELAIKCTVLHSKLTQKERMRSLVRFKGGMVPILITTDLSSRGLDIPAVQLVINYDIPADPRTFIHRIGRTARAGRGGQAISIVGEIDIELVAAIEKELGKDPSFRTITPLDPSLVKEREVLKLLGPVTKAKRVATMALLENPRFISKNKN